MTETHLRVGAAARALDVSPERVRQLCSSGQLPFHWSGRERLIPLAAVLNRRAHVPHGRTLIANKTFTATIDGERQTFKAGVTGVAPDHEAVRLFPRNFSSAQTKPRAKAPTRSSSTTARSQGKVELWFAQPRSVAFADLTEELQGQIKSACRHEAGHAAVALRLGWRIDKVTALADGSGVNALTAPEGLDKRERLRQLAIICHAGRLAQGHSLFSREQDADDQEQIRDAVEYLTGSRFHERTHRAIKAEAQRFFNNPTFVRQIEAIAKALLENDGALDGDDVRRLLRRRAA